MTNNPAIRVQAITGWILIAHDTDCGWGIAWFDVFATKKTAIEFAVKNNWPHPYLAVRGRLSADASSRRVGQIRTPLNHWRSSVMRYWPNCTTDAIWMQEFKESVQQWFAEQAMRRCPIENPRYCVGARCQLFGVCDHNRQLDRRAARSSTECETL